MPTSLMPTAVMITSPNKPQGLSPAPRGLGQALAWWRRGRLQCQCRTESLGIPMHARIWMNARPGAAGAPLGAGDRAAVVRDHRDTSLPPSPQFTLQLLLPNTSTGTPSKRPARRPAANPSSALQLLHPYICTLESPARPGERSLLKAAAHRPVTCTRLTLTHHGMICQSGAAPDLHTI